MKKIDFFSWEIDGKTPLPSDRAWSRASKKVGPYHQSIRGPRNMKYASQGAENGHFRIGYKNIPASIDDAPKAVQGERNVVATISARSAQRI